MQLRFNLYVLFFINWSLFMSQNKRPLSPFMLGSGYKWQVTSVMSILHRASGVALVLVLLVIGAWLVSLAAGPSAFATMTAFLKNPFVVLLVMLGTFAACYHFCNGIRHLFWDAGKGVDIESAKKSARVVQIAAPILAVLILIVGFAA